MFYDWDFSKLRPKPPKVTKPRPDQVPQDLFETSDGEVRLWVFLLIVAISSFVGSFLGRWLYGL